MSERNLFVIKRKNNEVCLNKVTNSLLRIASIGEFNINFNIKEYYDLLLKKIDCKNFEYFHISDIDSTETDDLFNVSKCYEEKDIIERYNFLNSIIEILFNQSNIKSVDFYVSDQYSSLSDYENIIVKSRDLTKAFADMLQPQGNKDYFGLKTTRFVIE